MKKNKKNYRKILGLFFFIFFVLSLIIKSNVSKAAETWSYTVLTAEHATTRKTIGGFASEQDCFISRENAAPYLSPTACAVSATGKNDTNSDTYTLLAPIGTGDNILKTAPPNFGTYVNIMLKIAIGLCGALAVIMIVIGGIEYMGDESIFAKTQAKKQITNAILGLLIALGAWVLLNTINPDLLKVNIAIKSVNAVINLPDSGDGTVDSDCTKGDGGSYSVGSVSPAVSSAVTKLQQGWTISQLRVSSTNNTMTIVLKNGNQEDTSNVISMSPGASGYADVGGGTTGDRKTPRGTWTVLSMTTPGNGVPIYNSSCSNMGASYWLLNATVSGERGIGIHGNKSGTLGTTAGCIRLTNADILALLPYVSSGLQVVVT